jgi:UDP-glucose 4-epimerase
MPMRLGLTGSTGFLGSALRRHFVDQGDEVFALDGWVDPRRPRENQPIPTESLDWVIHLGATKNFTLAMARPVWTYQTNLDATLAAFEIALERNARFLYMSSYVYGHPQYLPIDERHPLTALNPYMGSKLAGETVCRQLGDHTGLSVAVIRGFTIYGPEQKGEMFIPSLIQSLRTGESIEVRDPRPRRDYLHVADFVRFIDRLVRSGFSGFEVYNVGGGRPYNNLDVARLANSLAPRPVDIRVAGIPRPGDVVECWADVAKAGRDFGWRPEIDLADGLRGCLNHPFS